MGRKERSRDEKRGGERKRKEEERRKKEEESGGEMRWREEEKRGGERPHYCYLNIWFISYPIVTRYNFIACIICADDYIFILAYLYLIFCYYCY